MSRPGVVARLPAEIRDLIGELRANGRTLDEIRDHLAGLRQPVARRTLARHLADIDVLGRHLRRSREVAKALIEGYGQAGESPHVRLNVELLHGLVTRMLVSDDGEAVRMEPREVSALSTALHNLARAAKADVDREAAIRERFAAAAAEAAAAQGVTKDTEAAIRAAIEAA